MSLNTQKEDFSYAYIYAVASSMGYSLQAATRRLDDSGIDATITVPGKINSRRKPSVWRTNQIHIEKHS